MKKEELNLILKAQKNEITEYYIYNNLAKKTKNKNNKKVLQHIAKDELRHHNFWKSISKKQTSFVTKPWGQFEQFTHNEISTVKILTVNENQRLSLQRTLHN